VAHNGLNQTDDAENAYKKAIEISPDQLLAWQGLVSFYEKRELWAKLADTLEKLIDIYQASGDGARLSESIQKLVDIYRNKDADEIKVRHLTAYQSLTYRVLNPLVLTSSAAGENSILLYSWKQIL
jgi:tetratricopeptide (TPR) repeat protein